MAGDNSWSWRQVHQESSRFASALIQNGINAGDSVAYCTKDSVEGFIMLWGIWLAGGVASPVNCTLPSHHFENLLKTLRPRYVLLGESMPPIAEVDNCLQLDARTVADISLFDLPSAKPEPNDLAMVLFTSGSTGSPKGAVSTHSAVALNAQRTAKAIKVTRADRIMINTPHYYTSAISHLLTLASVGGSVAVRLGFLFWETFTEEVQKQGCTGFGGAPSHFVRLFAPKPKQCPSCLRFLVSSGDHLPNHLAEYIYEHFPDVELYRVYGLTEVAGRLCILPPSLVKTKQGSVGRPLPGMKISIRDARTNAQCAPGQVGEIFVSGDMLASHYLGNSLASQALQSPRGFRTGDFGSMDEEGYITIQGRKDEVFKSGGEKVSCQLIQEEIMRLGVFTDVAVIPCKDDLLGMIPIVYHVTKADTTFSKCEIISALRSKLPQSHLPRDFRSTESIPRTGSGKVDRSELKAIANQHNMQRTSWQE
jgi:acyl-CoA synthetase (AMP-forming)/AMP-acid ligase II